MFSFIARNWRGQPLVSRQAIVSLIGATTSTAGLKVYAELDENTYERAIKITDAQLAAVNLTPNKVPRRMELHNQTITLMMDASLDQPSWRAAWRGSCMRTARRLVG